MVEDKNNQLQYIRTFNPVCKGGGDIIFGALQKRKHPHGNRKGGGQMEVNTSVAGRAG